MKKTPLVFNGKAVELVLTDEQISALENQTQSITDKVRTLDQAYEQLGIYRHDVNIKLPGTMAGDTLSVSSYIDAIVVARALNEDWQPDFDDGDQYKWYLVAEGSGFGFSYSFTYYVHTRTIVCARLCFRSKEIADHAAQYFWDVFQGFFKK